MVVNDHEPKMRFGSHPPKGGVTPFPIDLGRERERERELPPPPNQKLEKKGKEKNAPPSLLEIQQMQDQKDMSRRDEWIQSQRQPTRPPRPPQHENLDGADGRAGYTHPKQTNARHMNSNGVDLPYGSTPPGGTPVTPVSVVIPSPTKQSPSKPTQGALYLPPGARSPSTPPLNRPGTPTRPSYPSSHGHSQNSENTSTAPYSAPLGEVEPHPAPRAARERGLSSASRVSDPEIHPPSAIPPPNGKLQKQPPQSQAFRSPLANPYASQLDGHLNLPAVHPHPQLVSEAPLPSIPNSLYPVDEMKGMKLSNGPDRRETDVDLPKASDKEKKKFWGMGWGDKKDKGRDRREMEVPLAANDRRPSVDVWRDGHTPPAASGYGEDESRGRLLGLDFGRGRDQPSIADGVTPAIGTILLASWRY